MKQGQFAIVAIVLALGAAACGGSHRPPIVTPPPVVTPPPPAEPICEGRDVVVYTFDPAGNALPNVAVHSTEPNNDRVSDGAGFSHRWACSSILYTFELPGWHVTNCGGEQSCDLAGPEHNIHLARDALPEPPTPPEPPPPVPGVNIDPVRGAIWIENGVGGDDTGVRTFVIMHAGDLAPRWHKARQMQRDGDPAAQRFLDQILGDLNDMAATGHHVVRTWSHLASGKWPWNAGGSPAYNGLDALNSPHFVEDEVALLDAVSTRGMRMTLEAGGIDGIGSSDERRLMQLFNDALLQAGPWQVAWVAPINEPSSVHATSDDNGDVDPGYLRSLVDILRRGTNTLWHLGHGSNVEWDTGRFGQKFLTPIDQKMGYYHAYRAQDADAKMAHRFSWMYEGVIKDWKRFWIDGEGVGAPTSGQVLRYVSVTENGSQMNSPEALSLIVATQTLRGIGSSMSGNGVQRYQSFTQIVGFREIPWTVRQMQKDVATFRVIHHSGDVFRGTRVVAAIPDVRADGAIGDDGRFDYVIHSKRPGAYSLPVERGFSGKVCYPARMTCEAVDIPTGGRLNVSYEFGVLLDGRIH